MFLPMKLWTDKALRHGSRPLLLKRLAVVVPIGIEKMLMVVRLESIPTDCVKIRVAHHGVEGEQGGMAMSISMLREHIEQGIEVLCSLKTIEKVISGPIDRNAASQKAIPAL